jgi:hypothetical protein
MAEAREGGEMAKTVVHVHTVGAAERDALVAQVAPNAHEGDIICGPSGKRYRVIRSSELPASPMKCISSNLT